MENGKIIQDGAPQKLMDEMDSLFKELKMQFKISKSK